MEAYVLSDLVAHQTWSHVAENLSEDLRWNLCYEIMHAHRAVKTEATRVLMQLFVEGRLKKRRLAIALMYRYCRRVAFELSQFGELAHDSLSNCAFRDFHQSRFPEAIG
jgi:hypothetical protein